MRSSQWISLLLAVYIFVINLVKYPITDRLRITHRWYSLKINIYEYICIWKSIYIIDSGRSNMKHVWQLLDSTPSFFLPIWSLKSPIITYASCRGHLSYVLSRPLWFSWTHAALLYKRTLIELTLRNDPLRKHNSVFKTRIQLLAFVCFTQMWCVDVSFFFKKSSWFIHCASCEAVTLFFTTFNCQ